MAQSKKTDTEATEISILKITTGVGLFALVGTSPLIFNRMAEKAWRELLLPSGRKTTADRAQSLKHTPLDEYRASIYRNTDPKGTTRLQFPASGIKRAMATAALDLPGATKSSIGRLTWVQGTHLAVYGVPQLMMTVVRSADMKKTPDIRTRAVCPRWAILAEVNWIRPRLDPTTIGNLIVAAGMICGLGDFRQEKGGGSFGQFRLADENDDELAELTKTEGREAQDYALLNPEFYNEESTEMFAWFEKELGTRRARETGPSPKRKSKEIEIVEGESVDWIAPKKTRKSAKTEIAAGEA